MSDARAKAEARRAKILARENKKVSAISTDEGDEISVSTEASKPKERPLASRRNLVNKTISSKDNEDIHESNNNNDNKEENSVEKEDSVEKIVEEVKETKSSELESIKDKIDDKSSLKPEIKYVKKTLKEIEKEVAENTAKFDANVLKKENDKEKEKKKIVKKKVEIRDNFQPAAIKRLIRLVFIIIVAYFTAYRTYTSLSSSAANNFISNNTDEFSQTASPIINNSSAGRTWFGYFGAYFIGQVECVMTAVSLVWWVSSMLNQVVTTKFAPKSAKKEDIMSTLLNLYQNGFEGILEYFFSIFGEFAVYLFSLIVFSVLFSIIDLNSSYNNSNSIQSVSPSTSNEF